MGPMMGGDVGWAPMLIFSVILLAVLAVVVTGVLPAGRGGRAPLLARGRSGGRGSLSGAGGAGSGEDPLIVLRERYARGEIGDAEFERVLDVLLRTEQIWFPA